MAGPKPGQSTLIPAALFHLISADVDAARTEHHAMVVMMMVVMVMVMMVVMIIVVVGVGVVLHHLGLGGLRARCVIGQSSRYDDDQIAYHYDRERTVARLRVVGSEEP